MNTANQSPILGLVAGKVPTLSNRSTGGADGTEGDFAGLLADSLSSPLALAVVPASNLPLADIGQFGLTAVGPVGGAASGADVSSGDPGLDAALPGILAAQAGGGPAVPGQAGIGANAPTLQNVAPRPRPDARGNMCHAIGP